MLVRTARRMSTTARATLYQRVRRARTESSMRFSLRGGLAALVIGVGGGFGRGREDVAAAAAGLQEGLTAFIAEFAAETVDVDFDQIGEGIEGLIPDMLGDFGAANDTAGIAREIFEERVFLGGEGDGFIAAFYGLSGGIEDDVADGYFRGA